MQDKTFSSYYHLCLAVVANCFVYPNYVPSISKKRNKERFKSWQESNRLFANSNLIKMLCDCSDNFEEKKLQKKILEFTNKKQSNG